LGLAFSIPLEAFKFFVDPFLWSNPSKVLIQLLLSFQNVQHDFHCFNSFFIFFTQKEESLRGRPGYEHLSEQLHILIEAELPANVIDTRLRQAQEIIEELLKPVVSL
jgi:hypothetical protein